jgi:rhamnulokinase
MPPLVAPGTILGEVLEPLRTRLDLPPLRVIAPATHDTGSAVAGTPLSPGWAYISSGTWSLVGVEREGPLVGEAVAQASFTNEGGAYGTVRFLKNVMGLWILESCRREWSAADSEPDHDRILAGVSRLSGFPGFIAPDHHRFFNPPSMLEEVRGFLRETHQVDAREPVVLAKVVLDSLALRYAAIVRTIGVLTGERPGGLHVVGGGSRNAYLNQATADASGLPVVAGPLEATAFGNLAVQAIVSGELASLREARVLIARSTPLQRFEPRPALATAWQEAAARFDELERSGPG